MRYKNEREEEQLKFKGRMNTISIDAYVSAYQVHLHR